jgi:hypothetical protein
MTNDDPPKRLVTARLERSGRVVSDNIEFKRNGCNYKVADDHVGIVGPGLTVVAGPHADFPGADVYTVELLEPPPGASKLPFFNSHSGWEYVTIRVV